MANDVSFVLTTKTYIHYLKKVAAKKYTEKKIAISPPHPDRRRSYSRWSVALPVSSAGYAFQLPPGSQSPK
jgi:hypothetical protein